MSPSSRGPNTALPNPSLPDASLKVSRQPDGQPEIFYSLQGEGPAVGTPSVFLRLALCNLVCTWCDTKYTWDWRHYDYESQVMELPVERAEELISSYGCRHLVITGGEPLLQQEALVPLVRSLKERGFSLEVETNGTIPPCVPLQHDVDQWNVSPKLQNSGNAAHRREIPGSIQAFSRLPGSYFKFVVVDGSDLEEVRTLTRRYEIPRERIVLMPEGRTRAALRERSGWLSRACVEEGFRFTPRLHILLWGDKRGT